MGCLSGSGMNGEHMMDSDFECGTPGAYGDDIIPPEWVNDGWSDCGDSDG